MDTAIDTVAAMLGWGVVGYLLYREATLRKKPAESVQGTTLHDNWCLSLCLALYFTLSIGPLTQKIDGLFPWRQTSRLLAYISVGWAAWWLYRIAASFTGTQPSKWSRYLPGVMTALLMAIFPFSLARSPRPAYDLSLTLPDMLFRDILYLYVFVLLAVSAAACWYLLVTETTPLIRLRLALSLTSLTAASGLALVKIGAAFLRFYALNAPLLGWLTITASLLQLIIVLPWLLLYLPARMIVPTLQAWHSARTLWLLRDVRLVEGQVRRFCNPIAAETPTFWDILRRPDYYATRSLIHILDGRKQLTAHPDPEAIRLRQRLDGVEDQMDIPELLLFYARLGRQMRRESQRATSTPQEVTA